MIEEQLEFQISQYADGSLPESERALVELRLLSNVEARALLEEYRALDGALKSSMSLPAVNWDRLADHLSDAVAEERETRATTVLGRIGNFGRLAVAACVVLGVGGALLWTQMQPARTDNVEIVSNNPAPPPTVAIESPPSPAAIVVVRGPATESPASPPVVVVSVGPASSVQEDNWRVAEGVVTGPSRAIWIASSYDAVQDTQRLPY